jgi:phosphopantothenoylcysteine decarboxylase/phosphopantothenate--cysteine ligase
MGFAVAKAAVEAGHEVVLISGPVSLKTPKGVSRVDVVSACEMFEAVKSEFVRSDAVVMTAAVADWRPAKKSLTKLKKSEMSGNIELVRNPDILKSLKVLNAKYEKAGKRRIMVGFAAETGSPLAEASRKCKEKGLDFVVANDVTQADAGFGVSTNRVTFVFTDLKVRSLPLMSKLSVARKIITEISKPIAIRPENL